MIKCNSLNPKLVRSALEISGKDIRQWQAIPVPEMSGAQCLEMGEGAVFETLEWDAVYDYKTERSRDWSCLMTLVAANCDIFAGP